MFSDAGIYQDIMVGYMARLSSRGRWQALMVPTTSAWRPRGIVEG